MKLFLGVNEYLASCKSNMKWEVNVEGSKGKIYTVKYGRRYKGRNAFDYSCNCPAFDFRPDEHGYCKHIYQVMEQRCGWDQQMDGGHPEGDNCPKCGGPIYLDPRLV